MTIQQDLGSLSPGQIVELFEIDATSIGGSVLRFHNGTNGLNNPVVWQGKTYSPFPIEATGFQFNGKGQVPRPTLRIANVTGLLGALVREYKDLIGAKVTRKRTLVKYLDLPNFPGDSFLLVGTGLDRLLINEAGDRLWINSISTTADPNAALPDDIYYIDRKANENKVVIEFELAASFDLNGVMLPRRQIVQNVCPWKYRGGECGYTGTAYFDSLDNPVGSPASDVCGKRLASCKLRFGEFNELPFGGFPAAGLIQ